MKNTPERMKNIIIVVLAASIMACSLFLIKSITPGDSEKTTSAEQVLASEQRLQSQINGLSVKINGLDDIVSQIVSQMSVTGSPVTPPGKQELVSEMDVITAEAKDLATKLDLLQKQVAELQDQKKAEEAKNLTAAVDSMQARITEMQSRLKIAETSIGVTPITVNGLSVLLITNDIEINCNGSSVPGVAQFAIKIINSTGSPLTSIDVTGTINASEKFYEPVALGYPQLTDGAGLCSYAFYITQNKTLHFEAFGNGKTSLSIPVNGSITFRPKLSLLTAANETFSYMTLHLTVLTVSYDRVATK